MLFQAVGAMGFSDMSLNGKSLEAALRKSNGGLAQHRQRVQRLRRLLIRRLNFLLRQKALRESTTPAEQFKDILNPNSKVSRLALRDQEMTRQHLAKLNELAREIQAGGGDSNRRQESLNHLSMFTIMNMGNPDLQRYFNRFRDSLQSVGGAPSPESEPPSPLENHGYVPVGPSVTHWNSQAVTGYNPVPVSSNYYDNGPEYILGMIDVLAKVGLFSQISYSAQLKKNLTLESSSISGAVLFLLKKCFSNFYF